MNTWEDETQPFALTSSSSARRSSTVREPLSLGAIISKCGIVGETGSNGAPFKGTGLEFLFTHTVSTSLISLR